ncbi:serine hydrolase FSH [Aspergillus alliaceus]|uniref:Serine hydrolase FSH n=1 Tax=Petromyces alliaceus TaxID=209559 RepID=A0A5N6FPL9_PETAA|nr:serine hydrolase FSH [Aspergillus alliaceus]KAB8231931.1 serine hydrolase FSH [Aspergillus alliaceus]KAE8387500.1 serine hydrolase FSH [Aspergillus alliaceus]
MRFLCLHGSGTSGEIFEIQSGGLAQHLAGKGHSFTYINGRLDSEPEPELKGVMDPPFYNHYPRNTAPGEDLAHAIEHTMRIIEKQGPFDAVMGFSQGAALAFSLLVNHAKTHGVPLFKAAVFICGAPPYEPSGREQIKSTPGEYLVKIPTAHIVGKQDRLYDAGVHLYGLCEPSKAEFYDHGSRHMIPFDAKNTEAMVASIEKTIERATKE